MSEQINVKGTITMGEPERRDLFAAAALSGLLAGNRNVGDNSVEALAKLAFQIADVMLSASAENNTSRESNP
jgi:hypothetical protein